MLRIQISTYFRDCIKSRHVSQTYIPSGPIQHEHSHTHILFCLHVLVCVRACFCWFVCLFLCLCLCFCSCVCVCACLHVVCCVLCVVCVRAFQQRKPSCKKNNNMNSKRPQRSRHPTFSPGQFSLAAESLGVTHALKLDLGQAGRLLQSRKGRNDLDGLCPLITVFVNHLEGPSLP